MKIIGSAQKGAADLIQGLSDWRLWHLLGSAELRRRYARSPIGQFWLTLSTGVIIGTMAFVWARLWNTSLESMLPYAVLSYILWQLMLGIISEMTTVFVNNASFFINQQMKMSTIVYSVVYRNLLVFAHNAINAVLVFLLFLKPVGSQAILAIPGLILLVTFCCWFGYVIGILATRYRDLIHIVQNAMQVTFFVTPILWKEDFIPAHSRWIVDFNPFAAFLSIVRDPLLGVQVAPARWLLTAALAFGGGLLFLPFIGRYHRRIVFWV
jgi:lipopolysaccharide transport system permease protein